MSFLSAFPANLAKLQYREIYKRSTDVVAGYEYTSALIRLFVDVANAYDEYIRATLDIESALGRDETVSVKLLGTDAVQGLEFVTRIFPVFDASTSALDVLAYVHRRPHVESAETAETSSMLRMLEYIARARSLTSARLLTLKVSEGNARYQSNVARSYKLTAQGRDFAAMHYPVSESVVQDRINAYNNALKQLSGLQDGRYAYAQDWNVLADYAKAIINYVVDFIKELEKRGHTEFADLYEDVLECERLLSAYKYMKSGDVLMPDHTNILIDVVRCLELKVLYRLLLKILAKLRIRVVRRNIISFDRDDSAKGLEGLCKFDIPPFSIVLVNTDDWWTVSSLIEDGTIVFVNFGTKAMTPSDVREIVENKEVVFAILVDTQPFHRRPAGAFYEVFYTCPLIMHDDSSWYVEIINNAFLQNLGFTGCRSFTRIQKIFDFTIGKYCKIKDAIDYAISYYAPNLYYSYAKYKKGAIIEMPYDGSWQLFDQLDWYIGAIAHILLGDPNNCYIAYNPVKLKRIVWMASYGTDWQVGYPSADRALHDLANRSGWTLVDMRNRC
jgi:hypothetical protein